MRISLSGYLQSLPHQHVLHAPYKAADNITRPERRRMNQHHNRTAIAAIALALTSFAGSAAAQQDAFQWLENVEGKKSMEWVTARNAETRAKLKDDAGFAKLKDDLLVVLNSKDRIPGIYKMGDFVYNFWTDAANPRGVWRRTTLEEYRKATPAWETVLDIDAIGKAENVNWVFKGRTAASQCMTAA
jgi:prolyl oligopeptidase